MHQDIGSSVSYELLDLVSSAGALAVALLEERGFSSEDFALLHPAGHLGKMLLLRVCDIMHTGDQIPLVYENTNMMGTFQLTS